VVHGLVVELVPGKAAVRLLFLPCAPTEFNVKLDGRQAGQRIRRNQSLFDAQVDFSTKNVLLLLTTCWRI